MSGKIWLIWSNEHKCWWAPNKCGYFTTVPPAGRYTTEEALRICSMRSVSEEGVPPEIMVPAPEFLERLKTSELVPLPSTDYHFDASYGHHD